MNHTIRQAKEDDAKAIALMHAQSWIDTYANDAEGVDHRWVEARVSDMHRGEKLKKRIDFIRKSQKGDDILYLVAQDEMGAVIGFALSYRTDEIQRIGAVYVAKEYHGKGVGPQLMNKVIDWINPKRATVLDVATYNERAKAFYRKYGFIEVEGSRRIEYEKIPVVTMIRKGEK